MEKLIHHSWPRDRRLAEIWKNQVAKSRSDDFHPSCGDEGTFVRSNHFPLGKRSLENLETDYPSIFMTGSEYLRNKSPKKMEIKGRKKGV